MSMFLTPDEVAELTDCQRTRLQVEWLARHNYEYELSRIGRPKVLRKLVEQRLGLKTASEKRSEPD